MVFALVLVTPSPESRSLWNVPIKIVLVFAVLLHRPAGPTGIGGSGYNWEGRELAYNGPR